MYPKLCNVSAVSLIDIIYGVYVDIVKFLILLGTFPVLCVPSTTYLSNFNKWLNCLLCLRNGLLSVMIQQSCNNVFLMVSEKLAHMKYNLCKIS